MTSALHITCKYRKEEHKTRLYLMHCPSPFRSFYLWLANQHHGALESATGVLFPLQGHQCVLMVARWCEICKRTLPSCLPHSWSVLQQNSTFIGGFCVHMHTPNHPVRLWEPWRYVSAPRNH